MAFKFNLPKQCPEELAETERAENENMLAIIADRTNKINALSVLTNLSTMERGFVEDMIYRATTFGFSGLLGETLIKLTDSQVSRLEKLYVDFVKNYI